MQVAAPLAVHPRMHPQEFTLLHPESDELAVRVDLDEQMIVTTQLFQPGPSRRASRDQEGEDASDIEEEDEEEDIELEDDTRLRYQRLQARGRAAELAFNNRLQREKEDAEALRSKSRSRSRSRPGTPILGALFKRRSDNVVLGITRSQSPPVPSVEKSSRRPSMSNLFKLKPLSRSSSSKSIYNPSTSSSQATSPSPSPLTPLSPLPFFLSPKTRRKAIPSAGEEDTGFGSPLARTRRRPSPTRDDPTTIELGFGSPLARTARRPSPTRVMTLPDNNVLGLGIQYKNPLPFRHRDSSPLRREHSRGPATGPHLVYSG